MKKKFSELQATKTPMQQAQLHVPVSVQLQQQHVIHQPVVSLEVPLQTIVQQPVIQPPVSVVKQEATQQHVVIQHPVSVSKQETVQQPTTTWKASPSYTQQQAIVSTPIVQNTSFIGQDNSVHYLEEIRTLKSLLQQKDIVIEKLYFDQQELATKLAVSESNNLSLSREYHELKQDKIDLKNDKVRLNEEIISIKQLELVKEEQLQRKASELEQLKKEFAEFNFSIHDSSFAQEEQVVVSQIIAPQHHQVNNPLLMGNTVESILLSQEEGVDSNNNINDHSSIILPENQESLLIGQSMQSIDFSLIE